MSRIYGEPGEYFSENMQEDIQQLQQEDDGFPIGLEGVFIHQKVIFHVKYTHEDRILNLFLANSSEPYFSWRLEDFTDDDQLDHIHQLIVQNLVSLNHWQKIYLNKRYDLSEM